MPVRSGISTAFDASYYYWTGSQNLHIPKLFYNQYEITSIGHKGWRSGLGSGDVGGPFRLFKETVNVQAPTMGVGPFYGPLVFEGQAGGWSDLDTSSDFGALQYMSNASLESKGTHAVAQSLPTNPTADLSTFVGELREGAPRAVGLSTFRNKVDVARSAGDEYLNVEFGWKPMVSDLRKFAHAVKHGNKVIKQYRRDSDKKIKRRYLYPTEKRLTIGHGAFAHSASGAFATGSISIAVSHSMWFEGCFRYHVPVPDTTMGKLAEYESYANKLLGVRLTPETVWNLSPWSWAADWFGTTGDVLHNISSLGRDGLVMQYGYMMSTQEREEIKSADAAGFSARSVVTKNTVLKQRIPATPYGFGFDLTQLTTKQVAILAALGISRR